MAIVVSCDVKYYDRFAGPFVRSVKRNTRQSRVYVSIVTQDMEPWQLASERFFFARKIDEPELVILDIDSVFIGNPEFPKGDVGLYLRPDGHPSAKVAAGLVVIRDMFFLDSLCDNLEQETGWFADQKALWKTYTEYKADYFDVSPFLTWDFDEKPIWTGKGPRKKSDIFKNKMAEYGGPL